MLIKSIGLSHFLSYGEDAPVLPLQPLNVVIGPNGSGKSNLLEAIELLRNAPDQVAKPIREGGGIIDWLWKGGDTTRDAELNTVFDCGQFSRVSHQERDIRYVLSFTSIDQRFEITDERLEDESPHYTHNDPYIYYTFNSGRPYVNVQYGEENEKDCGLDPRYEYKKRELRHEYIDRELSILSQRRDPEHYPEITQLASSLSKIKLYREWNFGRHTPPRMPQKADLPNDFLEPDCSNLGLVLNRLEGTPESKKTIIESLNALYDGIDGYYVKIEGGTVQVFFQEGYSSPVPATRLSDGTLRYLCLLAILVNPDPPPLVCIDEPELGLHPDVLHALADLIKKASERCQLIVTTHSDILVDAMTEIPDSVIIAERDESGSVLKRIDPEELKPWLKNYRLGELWTRGNIGGTRW